MTAHAPRTTRPGSPSSSFSCPCRFSASSWPRSAAHFSRLAHHRDTRTSLGQSNAEQIISTYVTKDVQASATVAPAGRARAATAVVLETTGRTDPMAASNVTVAYALTGTELVGQFCRSGSVVTIANNVTSLQRGAEPGEDHRRNDIEPRGRRLFVDPSGAEAAGITAPAPNRSLSNVKWDGRGGACGTEPAWHGTGAASVAQVHHKGAIRC